ncbi:cell division cycle protein 48 [Dorcoceras hygrometricum]|uniref:Cell division cycle protein 48 n=1 Tax=Dorcoceras hygrometricum TaxID=472368 RepID=A0A2Z7AM86_9LAMI|nr:cell division cycle protein 48 [Dorcoceras hygrometricum]
MQSMATNVFSAYASVAASMMLFRSVAYDMIPEPVKSAVFSALSHLFKRYLGRFFNPPPTQITVVVDEQCGFTRNQIYDAAEVYLRTVQDPDSERFKVNKSSKQKSITVSMVKNQEAFDYFNGHKLRWQFVVLDSENKEGRYQPEKRFFELTLEKQCKDDVLREYLPHVIAKAKEIRDSERAVKLYTRDRPFDNEDGGNGGGYWGCINLDHPSTFDKLAMDPCLKRSIIEDLDRFLRRRDYYKKVGKAWKRGYLLYGPPGTGKSSLIAAMANYLKFDVYDLELASLYSNSELRSTLLSTTNRSIIVIEDIDCSVQMHDRISEPDADDSSNTRLTLSGVLNFIDGLWSACGDERIIIFTTNHKDKLDPALLRPGRMDMHICMGYCTPEGFDVLALNYLGIKDQTEVPLGEIKGLIRELDITPAEIAEYLMRSEDVDLALQGVLDLLKKKRDEKTLVPVDEKKRDIGEAKDVIKSDGIVAHKEQKTKSAKILNFSTRKRLGRFNNRKAVVCG